MRYRAIISYLGTKYVGWQRQINGLSVQEVLENALTKMFRRPTHTVASGRTDAGVHAAGQVVHFDAETTIPADKIPFAVNTLLPDDVSMLACEIVSDDFNARFNAKKKTYCYKLYLSKHRLPLLETTHEQIVVPLDLAAMKECARLIEGTHDFKCFEASGSVIKSTVRTVYGIKIETTPIAEASCAYYKENDVLRKDASTDKNLVERVTDCEMLISVTGNGFLYNMVRIIAGTLVYAGMGKIDANEIVNILESGDRKRAGKTLSAKGLHLIKVEY